MKNNTTPSRIRINTNYIITNFSILFKRTIEYKANFWSSIIAETTYNFWLIFFYFIIVSNFSEVISWNIYDFFLFFITYLIIDIIVGLFTWSGTIKEAITSGELNSFLTKPLPPFIAYSFSTLAAPALIMFTLDIIFFTIGIQVGNIQLYNILLSTIFFTLILILAIAYTSFLLSLDFIFLGLTMTIGGITGTLEENLQTYPSPFFSEYKYKWILNIFPIYFISELLIPVIRNHNITPNEIYTQLILLLTFIIIFTTITIITWHYGLKKYEAFG